LGALAHELLTRYPPFYPHFDALQVQEQDPPRPVPAQPAPVELLDLVQAMLARDAAQRPTLDDAVGRLQHFLASTALPEEEGVTVVQAAAAAGAARAERAPRTSQMWWWGLLAAGAAGLGALLLLPGPTAEESRQAIEQVVSPPSVADALVAEVPVGAAAGADTAAGRSGGGSDADAATQAQAAIAAADAADAPALPTLADELRAGRQALDALRPAEATAAFHRALAIEADNTTAREGLAAAVRQQELL